MTLSIVGIKHNNDQALCWVSCFIDDYTGCHYAEYVQVTATISDIKHNNDLLLCWVSCFIGDYAGCRYAECRGTQKHSSLLIKNLN
jgi:hypothetical protein